MHSLITTLQAFGCLISILLIFYSGLPVIDYMNGRLLIATKELAGILLASGLTIIFCTLPRIKNFIFIRRESSTTDAPGDLISQNKQDVRLVAITLLAIWVYANYTLYRWTCQWSAGITNIRSNIGHQVPQWMAVYLFYINVSHGVHAASTLTILTLVAQMP
jgi:hypothetical protein